MIVTTKKSSLKKYKTEKDIPCVMKISLLYIIYNKVFSFHICTPQTMSPTVTITK